MRLDDYRTSDNVGDERGENFGGGGGGLFGLLFGIVASRFGIGGIVVLIIGALIFGANPMALMGGGQGTLPGVGNGEPALTHEGAAKACAVDAASKYSCQVLASTEDTWAKIFQQQGKQYTPAGLVFYSGNGSSGCGAAQTAMGPFYCPTDKRVYLDTEFYDKLKTKFGSPGDFAQAYVIAHEVGHHVQDLLGILPKVERAAASGERHRRQCAAGQDRAAGGLLRGRLGGEQPRPDRARRRRGRAQGRRMRSATTRSSSRRRAASRPTASPTAPRRSGWNGSRRVSTAAIPRRAIRLPRGRTRKHPHSVRPE